MTDGSPVALLVGHCGPDAFALRSAVTSAAPKATVEMVNDAETLHKRLPEAKLLLVNRVLDGRFDSESGLELIQSLRQRGADVDIRLISNFSEAQQEAEAAGAATGFGKRDLYDPQTRRLIAESLGAGTDA